MISVFEPSPQPESIPPPRARKFRLDFSIPLLFIKPFFYTGTTCSSVALKAPVKKESAPSAASSSKRDTKGKKRARSPSTTGTSKRVKLDDGLTEAESKVPVLDLASVAHLFAEVGPQMSRILAALGEVPYNHPTLTTAPGFSPGIPAKGVIPEKEPTGSRRVLVKRLPAWRLEPDLESFGPYVKKGGVGYTPSDLSTLARALPDVSHIYFSSNSDFLLTSFLDFQPYIWSLPHVLFPREGS